MKSVSLSDLRVRDLRPDCVKKDNAASTVLVESFCRCFFMWAAA